MGNVYNEVCMLGAVKAPREIVAKFVNRAAQKIVFQVQAYESLRAKDLGGLESGFRLVRIANKERVATELPPQSCDQPFGKTFKRV